jgi:hypothetical protein
VTARDRGIVIVLALAAVIAGYWFLLLAPKREQVARLDKQIAVQRTTLRDALAKVQPGLEARAHYRTNYASMARLGQAVPADDGVPSLVFQLESAAKQSDVDFRAVKLTTAEGTSSSQTATPTEGGSSSAAALPPGASKGAGDLPAMPFALTFDGSFFHMSSFFARLDRFVAMGGRTIRVGGRLLTVEGIALEASRNGFPQVKATVAATAYVVPPGEGLTGGATPNGPAGTTAVSGSSSGSSTGSASATTPPTAAATPPTP